MNLSNLRSSRLVRHKQVSQCLLKIIRPFELYRNHMLFFISLSAPITSTLFVLPVAFCIVGSCHLLACLSPLQVLNRLRTLSRIKALYSCILVSLFTRNVEHRTDRYLLVANRKLPLCLLIVLRKRLQLLYRFCLQHRNEKLNVLFRVLMAGLFLSVSYP